MEEKPLVDDEAEPLPGEYGQPIPREIMLRELGFSGRYSRHSAGKRLVSSTLATKAVHTMCTKDLTKRVCPFKMVYSWSNSFNLSGNLNFLIMLADFPTSGWSPNHVSYSL